MPTSPVYEFCQKAFSGQLVQFTNYSGQKLPCLFISHLLLANFVVLSKEQEVVGLVKLASNAPRWSKGEHDLNVVDFLTS